jgi:hypothetical protein
VTQQEQREEAPTHESEPSSRMAQNETSEQPEQENVTEQEQDERNGSGADGVRDRPRPWWLRLRSPKLSKEIAAALIGALAMVIVAAATLLYSVVHDRPAPALVVTLDPARLTMGQCRATIRVKGLEPYEGVRIRIGDEPLGIDGVADADGDAVSTLKRGPKMAAGRYEINVHGLNSGRSGSTVLEILPDPSDLEAVASSGQHADHDGLRLTIDRVRRHTNWFVVIEFQVTNSRGSDVTLEFPSFSAVDGGGKRYGAWDDNEHTHWDQLVPARSRLRGEIALDKSVHPTVESMTLSFATIATGQGTTSLSVSGVPVPRGTDHSC